MFKMTPAVLRNFVGKPATRRYPASVRPPFEQARGLIQNDVAVCTFCGVCAAKCPSRCITVDKKTATWTCNPMACVYCGVCAESCPSGSLIQKTEYRRPVREKEMMVLKGEVKKAGKGEKPVSEMS